MRFTPFALPLALGCAQAPDDTGAPDADLDAAVDDDLTDDPDWKDGDLVFQASQSEQSRYVMLATGSRLTHMGLIDVRRDGVYVVEAVQPVKVTTLEAFRGRYDDARLAVKRVPGLTDAQRSAVVKKARTWVGRDYDRRFGWDDATLYCSELAWKAYDYAVDVQIARLRTFDDFVLLDTPIGAEFVARRWGKNGPDRGAPVVSPADIWRSADTVAIVGAAVVSVPVIGLPEYAATTNRLHCRTLGFTGKPAPSDCDPDEVARGARAARQNARLFTARERLGVHGFNHVLALGGLAAGLPEVAWETAAMSWTPNPLPADAPVDVRRAQCRASYGDAAARRAALGDPEVVDSDFPMRSARVRTAVGRMNPFVLTYRWTVNDDDTRLWRDPGVSDRGLVESAAWAVAVVAR